MRPGIGFSIFGPDELKGKLIFNDHDSVVSIPMYCKMTGLSLSEIEYESIRFKIHSQYNNIDFVRDTWRPNWQRAFDDFSSVTPSEDLTYKNPSLISNWKFNFEQEFIDKNRDINAIFGAIVVISMVLCFFSLSSSMTANIYDQSQEISVMCSFGCTKKMLVQIFVCESLVLVVSSSIGAFFIGIFVGNLIFLQCSMIQSVPFEW